MKKEDKSSSNGFGIASLILGILSILSFFTIVFPFLFAILSIIFGVIQRKRSKSKLALWGIILSIAGIVITILYIVLITVFAVNIIQTLQNCQSNPELPGCIDILNIAQNASQN